ncbi:MAG: NAD(P)-binding protein [Planctomycetes bacterium]|nr:NAD(P)-binding protein [Planctomycetota bacterium]
MNDAAIETVDAIIVGSSMRGLVTAYVLSQLGCRAVLLERGDHVGSADGSFTTSGGTSFDFGLHVLDAMRSPLATRLFTHVVDGAVHEQVLRRAIVLRGHVLPYNPKPADLPGELRAMLRGEALVDDIGDELPTRARLAACYGPAFADLVLDEVLPSYPTENRHRAFGVDEARLLTNIYPWFFPAAQRVEARDSASRMFHDRLRRGHAQRILYPQEGGFGGFARGFLQKLDPRRVEVLTGARDLNVQVRPGTHAVEWVAAGGRRFAAPHVFWAAPWPALCQLLSLPCQQVVTDRVLLGSFRLDRPALGDFHEYLVGDPRRRVNRISRPASFRGSDDPLLQVEFAVPIAEDWPREAAVWQRYWQDDLVALGLLAADHRVVEFDFRDVPLHFNAFGAEGEPLRDADPALVDPAGNMRPVVPSMANLNLNAYVPQVVADVAATMARG